MTDVESKFHQRMKVPLLRSPYLMTLGFITSWRTRFESLLDSISSRQAEIKN